MPFLVIKIKIKMTQTVREMMTMKKLMLRMSQKTQMTKSSAPTKV